MISGNKKIGEYFVLEKIGQGSFSKVKKVMKDGIIYAAKISYIEPMKKKYRIFKSKNGKIQ